MYVILGSTEITPGTTIETGMDQHDLGISFGPEPDFLGIGTSVRSADINGDRFGDILVGHGSVLYVFFGGPLRAPEISKAKYRPGSSQLLITGTDLTGPPAWK